MGGFPKLGVPFFGIRWADMQKREPTCRVGGPRCKKGRPSDVRPKFRVGGPRCKKRKPRVRRMFRVGGPRCKKKEAWHAERPRILARNRALAWSVLTFSPEIALSRRASSHSRWKSRSRVERPRILAENRSLAWSFRAFLLASASRLK